MVHHPDLCLKSMNMVFRKSCFSSGHHGGLCLSLGMPYLLETHDPETVFYYRQAGSLRRDLLRDATHAARL